MFHTGSNVKIKATENVLSRFPELIGKRATVVSSPTHPSTWFSIKVEENNQVIKLQPTAMTLIEEVGGSEETTAGSAVVAETTISRSGSTSSLAHDDANVQYDGGHQRAKSMGHVVHCSLAPMMKKGCSVTVLRTENVLQRAPHLVGREGVVKEAPVHPATWFKVEFPDKSVFTFRPSALVLTADIPKNVTIDWSHTLGSPHVSRGVRHISSNNSSENEDGDKGGRRKRKRSEKLRQQDGYSPDKNTGDDDGTEEEDDTEHDADGNEVGSGERRGRKRSEALLTSVDPETWPGRVVRMKGTSRTGLVLKTGNGWVQVNTNTGEIAKRAYELQLVGSGNRSTDDVARSGRSSHTSTASSSSNSNSNSSKPSRVQETTNIRIGSYKHTSTAPSLHIQIDCQPTGRPRSYSEPMVHTPTDTSGMSYYGISSPKLFLTSSPRVANLTTSNTFSFPAAAAENISGSSKVTVTAPTVDGIGGAAVIADGTSTATTIGIAAATNPQGLKTTEAATTSSSDTTTTTSDTAATIVATAPETTTDGEKKKEYFIKKASPLLLQARKEYIQKYVSRTQEKLENRPDLTYWKRAITSAIMVDTKFELDSARRDVDECLYYCPCCMMERWEGGMFCWNENCKESPIYWKLPGTRGKPLTPRKPKPVTSEAPTQASTASSVSVSSSGDVIRRVSNKKWSVNLINNVPSLNGNNENYLSYHKNDDNPSASRPGKDTHEYNFYYEYANPRIPRLNPVVSDDLLQKPFAQLLDGRPLMDDGSKEPVAEMARTPEAVAELDMSLTASAAPEGYGHPGQKSVFYGNDQTNKLCQNKSIIFMDENEMEDDC